MEDHGHPLREREGERERDEVGERERGRDAEGMMERGVRERKGGREG